MKPILYATPLCSDCEPMRDYLISKNFDFEYVDITSDILLLREFVTLRDTRDEFLAMKEKTYLGVPALFMDDKFYFDEEIKEIIK